VAVIMTDIKQLENNITAAVITARENYNWTGFEGKSVNRHIAQSIVNYLVKEGIVRKENSNDIPRI